MKTLLSLLIAGFLLLPSFSYAQSLSSFQDKLVFQPNENFYHLRSVTKPWQIVGLPVGFQPEQYEVIGAQLYMAGTITGKKVLYVTSDGLRFTVVANTISDQLVIKKIGQNLVVATSVNGVISYALINNLQQRIELSHPILSSLELVDRLIDNNGELTLIMQSLATDIFAYRGNAWVVVTQLPCASSALIEKPVVAVKCADQLYYPVTPDSWVPYFPEAINAFSVDEQLFAQSAVDPARFFLSDGIALTTISLTDFGDPLTAQLLTLGSRQFIRGSQLWEVILAPSPAIVAVDQNASALLMPALGSERLYLHSAEHDAFSDQPSQWETITVAADYTNALKTNNGYLLWKKNGNSTQFAANGTTIYQTVTTSWAASSKIQELLAFNGVTFLYLLNSSGNPNLYKTTDFGQWTRITLPTNPTYGVTIGEARLLPAGSLVNISGIITVLPGTVANEVLYLQDTSGGIQVFLSATKGTLPMARHYQAEATGSISTSQVKRITLDALDDLVLGSAAAFTLPNTTPTEAVTKLGQSVTLVATVNSFTTDYLNLAAAAASLRLRYKELTTEYQSADEGHFPAVVDYNSSSGQVEAWSLGGDILTNRLTPVTPPEETTEPEPVIPPVAPTIIPTNPTLGFSSTVEIKTVTATTTSATTKTSSPTAQILNTTPLQSANAGMAVLPAEEPLVLPASSKETSPNGIPLEETFLLCFLSLLAGILSLRGRRFRRLFDA